MASGGPIQKDLQMAQTGAEACRYSQNGQTFF
jgi:hypothetical protein